MLNGEDVGTDLTLKINKIVRKRVFIDMLKGLKSISEKNYLVIRIYYFIMRNNFRNFLKRIVLCKNEINNKELKKLSLLYNYTITVRSFFKKFERRKNFEIKNRQSLFFYSYKLRQRFFYMIKRYAHDMKIYNKTVSHIYSDYLLESIIKYLRKFYYNRDMRSVIRNFILNKYFKKLTVRSDKQAVQVNAVMRRTRWLFLWKLFKNKIRLANANRLSKLSKRLGTTKYYLRLYLHRIRREKITSKNLKSKISHFKAKSYFLFFARVVNRLKISKQISSKIICLSDKITQYCKKLFFSDLITYNEIDISEEFFKNKNYFERIYYKKVKLRVSAKKKFKKNKSQFNFMTNTIYHTVTYKNFFKNIQQIFKLKRRVTQADKFKNLNLMRNFFDNLLNVCYLYLNEKGKYITALLTFRKNFISKFFNALKMNRELRLNQRIEYDRVFQLRNKVIEENMFRLLISNCTKEMKQKDDIKTNLYIKRTTRGIKTALKWYQKLKSRILSKKLNQSKIAQHHGGVINPPLVQQNNDIIDKKDDGLKSDLNILLSLRNKKREAPKNLGQQNI
jgi:hypothetical protein